MRAPSATQTRPDTGSSGEVLDKWTDKREKDNIIRKKNEEKKHTRDHLVKRVEDKRVTPGYNGREQWACGCDVRTLPQKVALWEQKQVEHQQRIRKIAVIQQIEVFL